jgi:hypothetical protein
MDGQETTACKYCGKPTPMPGTKLCDGCWELETCIKANPVVATRILKPDLLPELHKANKIIKTLKKLLKENDLEIPSI